MKRDGVEKQNIFFSSLGCDKNLSDSEHMLAILRDAGFSFTDSEDEADVAIVNSCCFIGDACEESIQEILRLSEYKKDRLKALIVTGCLSERFKDDFFRELPEVDGILGIGSFDHIAEVVEEALSGKRSAVFLSNNRLVPGTKRVLSAGSFTAYLKIAEGCDKFCTYCVIPHVRGRYRSVPMEELVEEAKDLASQGVRELILVAQETTIYGKDLYGENKLPELIGKLSEIPDIRWIRLLYAYPEEITDALIDTIKSDPKLCHYIDIPIQSASDKILKRMGRKTTYAEISERIRVLREKIPDIALRTTFITGFPGETEEDFEKTLDFIKEVRFDRLGAFTYSREEGTAAYGFEDQVPEEVKISRRDRLMALQQSIAFENTDEMIGSELECIVEGRLPEENLYVARSYMDAPDVDGLVFFSSPYEHMSGDFVSIRITEASSYDLIGELIDESAK